MKGDKNELIGACVKNLKQGSQVVIFIDNSLLYQ
jgi:hypothetical protein